jgi:biopolymer transport protein ExbD
MAQQKPAPIPAKAQNITAVLDVILMILNVLMAISQLFGIDFRIRQ